jgi:dihydrolipoamide dehydrogenase
MAELIIMPKLGFNMSEGKLIKWHKNQGEAVRKGEPFFAIETDKTGIDIESTRDGIVLAQYIEEGDSVPVTLPIAIVGDQDEDISSMEADIMSGKKENQTTLDNGGAVPLGIIDVNRDKVAVFDYDIVVIGGGPGGYVAAIKGAQLGKKVALVEKNALGGTCLNVGCIPTKTLMKSAEMLKTVKEASEFGVKSEGLHSVSLDMAMVQERKAGIVGQLVGGVKGLLRANGVSLIEGQAILMDSHTVQIQETTITGKFVILANGSKPKTLPIEIHNEACVLGSEEMLNLTEIPNTVAVIGGGVIGIEFAYFLASVGVKVTVIEFLDSILPMVDEEISQLVMKDLLDMGIEFHLSSQVMEIGKNNVTFKKQGKTEQVESDMVLMAVGRVAALDGLDCHKLGIETVRGAVKTDERLRTTLENVYAIGDINGKSMLAHTASMEGIIAVENICGKTATMRYDRVPSAIYIQPEVASVGLTEKEAMAKYGQVKVGKFPLLANGKAKVEGDERGLIKVIVDAKYGEIVGVHMYAVHATDMISEATLAMNLEATAEEVAMSIHPHPTVSEAIHEAMHGAHDRMIHFLG